MANVYFEFRPWWQSTNDQAAHSGTLEGEPPKVRLRCTIRKSVTRAFLALAISRDGSSGGTYDTLIGGVGAGLPAVYLNTGTAGVSVLSIAGNTSQMLQLDQLLAPANEYHFDLSQGVSLREFLTNEFIASQLLLGSLQSGALTLKSWVHEVAASVTLNPLVQPVEQGQRLSSVKRLDLSAGIRLLDLSPTKQRSVRFAGTTKIKGEEIQPIRFWRQGLNLTVTDIATGDLSLLVRAFYQLFGGAPAVYVVPCSIEDHLADGLEFGDAVNWSNADVVTPSGRGISGQFFVVGIDLDFDAGVCHYKLLKNTLYSAQVPATEGHIAPSLGVVGLAEPIGTDSIWADITPVSGASFDFNNGWGGLFGDIQADGYPLHVHNFGHAPVGDQEPIGSIGAHINITDVRRDGQGYVTQLRLTLTSPSYLRGSVASISDLLVVGETRLSLPGVVPAAADLGGATIEPHPTAAPAFGNFASIQPRNSNVAASFTFRRA